ncbi:MAG TPA: ketoacyl-ACP synthase III [Gemmatimonadales bacterium]|nr:ketoacyl-ACP synthase III [Gemmatimonadales bacterium]
MRARIAGTGHYLPGPPISNEELMAAHGIQVRSYFIRNSVGVETRHFAAPDQATSDLAAEAGRRALGASGVPPASIRRIILATVSGDYPTPATACVVQRKLGLRGGAAIDVIGACSGFLQALDLGARCVATGEGPVLVIGADIRSRQLNYADPRTVFLYGDGAGAVVLTESAGSDGLHHSILTADGEGAEAVYIPAGGSREPLTAQGLERRRNTITMANGRIVAEGARRGFQDLAHRLVRETGVPWADINFFCLHQPNLPLVTQILQDLAIPMERTWVNFPRYGNTTSATLPIALSEAVAAGKLRDQDWLCLGAVGAGYAGAIQLFRWGTS